MLIYIQTSTVHIIYRQLGVYIECILPVSIDMCTLRLIELLSKTLKTRAKCMRFFKIQLVSHCYTAVLYGLLSKLYIYKNQPYIFPIVFFFFFFFFVFFFFCKIQELRNPTTHKFVMLLLIALIYRRLLIFTTMIYYDYNT